MTKMKKNWAQKVMLSVLYFYPATALQYDDVCARGNCAQAQLRQEQCEGRSAGDWGE